MPREPELRSDRASEIRRPKKASERRNVTSNYLLAVMTVLVGFVVTPILTHQLGIQRYGVWALIGSLIPFLELLELGFANVTVAFVGRHIELGENEKVGATINTSFLILSVLGVIAFVGVVLFTIFLPDIITTIPKSLVGQAQFLLLLMAFDMALSIPMDTFGGALVALQRFDLLNYSLITVLVSQAIGWVIVLAFHGGLVALGVVTVAISLMGQVSRVVILHRLLPWFRLSLRRFDRGLLRTLTTLSGWYSLVQISDAVIDLSDVLIVGAAAGVEAAAVYAVAQRLGPLPVRIVQPRIYTLFTSAAELSARDDESGLRVRTDQVVRFVLLLSVPVAIALGFLAGPAVEAWVGPLYREAASIIGLLCLASIVQGWAFTARVALNGSRRPRLPAVLYGLEAALHVTLGIVLARRYGPVGMAEAMLIGVVTMEGMLLLPLAYRQLGGSFARTAVGFLRTLVLPVLCTGALGWFLGRSDGPLYTFTDTHGRVAGLAVVGIAGLALLGVFYAVLLVTMPAIQRKPLLDRARVWLGRLGARDAEDVAAPVAPDREEEQRMLLKDLPLMVDTGWWRTGGRPSADATATMGSSASGQAKSPNRGGDDMSTEVAPSTGVKFVAEWLGPADRALASWTGVKSVAHWLGPADRPLFAWLDLPDDNRVVGAVVLFPTIGLEADYSARAVRDLAHRLAAFRWAVLRVDYPGTGDSSGTWTDPDLVSDWRRSVREAIGFARTLGVPRVAVVGLRLGATLAASELGDELNVDDLVLWDPCATGKAFLREQRALWAFRRDQAIQWGTLREGEAWGSGDTNQDGSFEAPGVMFSAQTVSDLNELTIGPGDRRLASRELVLTREGRKLDRVLAERRGLSWVAFSEISGQETLLDADAVTPERTLGSILEWLNERVGGSIRIETPELPAAAMLRTTGRTAVLERPLAIGPTDLFGILSEPDVPAGRSVPTVIFLNAGRIGHQGPARLWVDLARSWSSEGLRCLRVDLSGLGFSPTRPGRTENVEFPADALDDLRDVRAFAAQFGTDVVLVGLCSGGYHAVEAAIDEPGASVCVINPALTYYRWNRHPDRRFEPDHNEGFEGREAWGGTRPWVQRAMLRLAPLQGAARKVPGHSWILKRFLVTASPGRLFDRLTHLGSQVLVVAGGEEAHTLCEGERRRYRRLTRSGSFSLETIPFLEHTLLERTGRDRVSELLHTWVIGRGAEAAPQIGREAEPQAPAGLLASERNHA